MRATLGTPENIVPKLSEIEADTNTPTDQSFNLDGSVYYGYFRYRTGTIVEASRLALLNAQPEQGLARVTVKEARRFGRTGTATAWFDTQDDAALREIAAEGTWRLLSGSVDLVRTEEILALVAQDQALQQMLDSQEDKSISLGYN